MRDHGPIVGLQVQVGQLKRGTRPRRWYEPSRIRPVDQLTVTGQGAVGEVDGQQLLDVHHIDHPQSRHRDQASGLSVMFTSHYRELRDRFGSCAVDGIAGENVLVDLDQRMRLEDLGGAKLSTAQGVMVDVTDARVAQPCVEFSRFMVGQSPSTSGGLKEPLQYLRDGMRGFYLVLSGPVTLRCGDVLQLSG